MPLEDERLRAAVNERPLTPVTDGCPAPEEYWEAVRGRLSVERSEAVLEHALGCSGCAAALRSAGELSRQAGAGQPAESSGPIPRRRWVRVAAAGGLTLACGLAALFWMRSPPESFLPVERVFRSTEPPTIQSQLAPDVILERASAHLRWSGGPVGTVYTVTLLGPGSQVLARHQVEATEWIAPATVLDQIPSGGSLTWVVEGRLPDGRRLEPRSFSHRVGSPGR
jgi:hypothetical protein